MRGRYYDESKLFDAGVKASETLREKDNAFNANRPQAVISPETPANVEDLRAIVAYVAHQILLNELDYHGLYELCFYHSTLKSITEAQIREAIREALA